MHIQEPYARIMDVQSREDGIRLLKKIEWCGRVSHASEDRMTGDSWEKFIRSVVLSHGDWSIVEHATVTVDVLVDRGITHEWVRHRIGAYTQSSTRFINYATKTPPGFIAPDFATAEQRRVWEDAITGVEGHYMTLIALGCAPQLARSVLPNSLASRLVVTYNLRNWRHFLLMRTTRETHPQMRHVTLPLLQEFQQKIPILFEDIQPEAKQSDNLKQMR